MPARPSACSAHPETPAVFGCEGCGRLLCDACVEEGHRLFFCRHCRERALPIELPETVTTVEKRRLDKRERPHSFADALRYCLRGQGPLLLAAYVVFMVGSGLVGAVGGCLAQLAPLAAVTLLLPGMLFEIVRQTATGETELPDWPDFFDYGERLREVWRFLLVGFVAAAPTGVLFRLLGCEPEAFLRGERGGACWAALGLGSLLGVPLAVFAFGATGVFRTAWLSFRIDLHVRALLAVPGEGMRTSFLLAALFVAGQLVDWVFHALPLLGGTIEHGITAYTLFTGAHLVGLIFRRHAATLERVYLRD